MAPGARLELALTVLETVVLAAGRPRYVRTWCRERHSKTQPHDYRSCALPLELSRRMESGVRIELTISCSQNERIASNAYPARTWSWRGDSNPGFILTKDVSCPNWTTPAIWSRWSYSKTQPPRYESGALPLELHQQIWSGRPDSKRRPDPGKVRS